jgi:FG-GAP-like repeat
MHISRRLILGVCFTLRLAGNRASSVMWLATTLVLAGHAGPAFASPPSIAKAFAAPSMGISYVTTLTFTITNPNVVTELTGVAFTDTLPSGLVVFTPNNLTTSCGGTATAVAGSSTISLTGGAIPQLSNCSISLYVESTTAGEKVNSVTVTSTNGGTGNTATATITIVAPPAIAKQFGVDSILLNKSTSLAFMITNPNASTELTGVDFTDSLPSGLVVSTPNNLTTSCGGTATAVADSSTISLLGGAVAASSNCSISLNVTATSVGVKDNSVAVQSSNGTGNTYSAFITVTLSPTNTHDFNDDGRSDIAWLDTSGDLALWLMNGATTLSTGGVSGVPGTWSIVGQRDFNGDGKADLLWLDTSGDIAMWFMNGAAVGSTAVVGTIPTNWSVAGVADFNGDGLGDILWRDMTGDYAVWLMNGATVTSPAGLGNITTWSVAGTGDFNGDGMADILWRDAAGDYAVWFMNGTAVTSATPVGTVANWSVVGIGDFNGDGKSDIVWRDAAGDVAIWLMNGAAVLSAAGLGNVPATWSVVLTGDFDDDGMSDLLWRDNSGNTAIWYMNGTTVALTGTVGNIPTNWTVQSVNAE